MCWYINNWFCEKLQVKTHLDNVIQRIILLTKLFCKRNITCMFVHVCMWIAREVFGEWVCGERFLTFVLESGSHWPPVHPSWYEVFLNKHACTRTASERGGWGKDGEGAIKAETDRRRPWQRQRQRQRQKDTETETESESERRKDTAAWKSCWRVQTDTQTMRKLSHNTHAWNLQLQWNVYIVQMHSLNLFLRHCTENKG
jgi:hypothetical protein